MRNKFKLKGITLDSASAVQLDFWHLECNNCWWFKYCWHCKNKIKNNFFLTPVDISLYTFSI